MYIYRQGLSILLAAVLLCNTKIEVEQAKIKVAFTVRFENNQSVTVIPTEKFKTCFDILKACKKMFLNYLVVFSLLQRTKRLMSDSPGLVDFAVRLVNFILHLPDRQFKFWVNLFLRKLI